MPARGHRTRLDPEVRRQLILDAAERVLVDRIPTEVTFEEIADAAEVSRGLVYNYFRDRTALLVALAERALERLDRELVAAVDPDPRVDGKGLALLRAAGIEVVLGCLEAEACRLNAGFFARMRLRRPQVGLKLATSADGRIASAGGDSKWITGAAARAEGHRLRLRHDAILVGSGTALADDPQLTTRHVPGPHPLRVIFDPSRRLSAGYRVFTDAAAPTLYVCRSEHVGAGETHVGQAPILGVSAGVKGGAPAALLQLLRERGCARVFIEGGGVTVSAFLEAGLLDRLHLAVAPVIIGSGRPATVTWCSSGSRTTSPTWIEPGVSSPPRSAPFVRRSTARIRATSSRIRYGLVT